MTAIAIESGNLGETELLKTCLADFGLDTLTAEEFFVVGIESLNQSMVAACKAGAAFWAAQEALKNTVHATGVQFNFSEFAERAGVHRNRVYECIRLAKYYACRPESDRKKILSLGKKHALLLAATPQEIIDDAAESGESLLDLAGVSSYKDLREKIKQLQVRVADQDEQIAIQGKQIRGLSEARYLTGFTAYTEDVRRECLALQAEAELPIETLDKLVVDIVNEDRNAPEWRLRAEQAWITGMAIAARVSMLLDTLHDNLTDLGMPDHIDTTHWLTAEEAERWRADYSRLCAGHESNACIRAEDDAPRRRGRPKGSTKR